MVVPNPDGDGLDLNGDGVNDLVVETSALPPFDATWNVRAVGDVRLAPLVPIPIGFLPTIDESLPWEIEVNLINDTGVGPAWRFLPPGGYPGGFVGLRLTIEGRFHYGWLRVEYLLGDITTTDILLLQAAYETRPDTPIRAGAIPEPASLSLLLVGCGLLLIALWRRR